MVRLLWQMTSCGSNQWSCEQSGVGEATSKRLWVRTFKNQTLLLQESSVAVSSEPPCLNCILFYFFRNTRSHEVCIWQSAALSRHSPDEFVQEGVSSLDVRPLRAPASTLGQERGNGGHGWLGHGVVEGERDSVLTEISVTYSKSVVIKTILVQSVLSPVK